MVHSFGSAFKLLRQLRAARDAPVDTMGAQALAQTEFGEDVFRFQVLVALLLSSQTKDQTVAKAMSLLQEKVKPRLSVEGVRSEKLTELHKCIDKVGFHNKKVKNLKLIADVLKADHSCDVPNDLDSLLKLPGIGPKMAIITLNICYPSVPTGIGVDTHVLRMSKQLGFCSSSSPESARKQLQAVVPRRFWSEYNLVLVGLGQQIQQKPEHGKILGVLNSMDQTTRKEAEKMLKKFGFIITRPT